MVNKKKMALLLALIGLTGSCGGGGGGAVNGRLAGVVGICTSALLIPNSFIVEVQTFGTTKLAIDQEIEAAADDNCTRLNADKKHVLKDALHGFVMVLPAGVDPGRIFEDTRVLRVQQDVVAESDAAIPLGLVVNIPIQEVPPGVRRIHADDPTLIAKIDGIDGPGERIGVGIAILDSGIDLVHPDLNVSPLGINIVDARLPPDDIFGHGTHVAGIAAALDNGFGVVGVAPGATLYPVKVLGDTGQGAMSDIIAGIDWVVANADKVAVANMSLHVTCPSPLLEDALRRAADAGVVVVTSAGNNGGDIYGPDLSYGTADDRAPGCFPETLAVSAMADFDGLAGGLAIGTAVPDDTLVSFSNSSRSLSPGALLSPPGLGIDLAAPGYAVLSTFPGGLYETMTGTSMASPHVAGAVARLVAVRGRDFNLDGVINRADVIAMRQLLVGTGEIQSQWRPGGTLDPDGHPEPLVDARTR